MKRKIHVLGTPMQIISPKRFEPLPGDLPYEHVRFDPRLDPSGHGRTPADFPSVDLHRLGRYYNIMTVELPYADPVRQVRELIGYARSQRIERSSNEWLLLVSEEFEAVVLWNLRNRRTAMGEPPLGEASPREGWVSLYGLHLHVSPVPLPLILTCPPDRWMIVGMT